MAHIEIIGGDQFKIGTILNVEAIGKDKAFYRENGKGSDVIEIPIQDFKEIHAGANLEDWPTGTIGTTGSCSCCVDNVVDDVDESDEVVRELIEKCFEAEKTIAILTAERNEYRSLNEHHQEQVEIGNKRREKMKYTVESLHGQLREKNETIADQTREIRQLETMLDRAERIIDYITKKPF